MESAKIKRNQSALPLYWLLGAITIAGIVFMLLPREDTSIKLRGSLKFSGDERALVNSYLRWNEGASVSNMTINHDFTAEGFSKMARALGVLSKAVSKRVGERSASKIDIIKKAAALLGEDQKSAHHADMVRGAFMAAGDILTLVQTRVFPELKHEIALLDTKVSMVKAEKLMLDQKNEIIAVYHQIAGVLTIMTRLESEIGAGA